MCSMTKTVTETTTCTQLAPGGHLGRFIVWTKSAFEALDTVFGTVETESGAKKGYRLPRTPMTNSDLTRLINSDEIQSIVNAPKVHADLGLTSQTPHWLISIP